MKQKRQRFEIWHAQFSQAVPLYFQPKKLAKLERNKVAVIYAEGLDDAWKRAQNDFNPYYRQKKVRSTCIGDIIASKTKAYMVRSVGFEELPLDVLKNGKNNPVAYN